MNYFRLGMSESSLLFLYYIENKIENYDKQLLIYLRKQLFNWFYTTSGFFDIKIKGRYFDFENEYENIIDSYSYKKYFSELLEFVKNNKFKLFWFKCHNLNSFMNYLPLFFDYIKKENTMINEKYNHIYKINEIIINNFEGKSILLIHNLSELMIEQYKNGNVKNINSLFPNVNKLVPLKLGYTFLNTPLDRNNIIERCDLINKTIIEYFIKSFNIDFVVISCGAYSSLIAKRLEGIVNYLMIGGELEKEFGIITNRQKNNINVTKYHIEVPDELKPEIHTLIENSCYW
jgi:hypothetical protein